MKLLYFPVPSVPGLESDSIKTIFYPPTRSFFLVMFDPYLTEIITNVTQ